MNMKQNPTQVKEQLRIYFNNALTAAIIWLKMKFYSEMNLLNAQSRHSNENMKFQGASFPALAFRKLKFH